MRSRDRSEEGDGSWPGGGEGSAGEEVDTTMGLAVSEVAGGRWEEEEWPEKGTGAS